MTEDQVRQIVKDEIKKNENSGSPDVPTHSHNGTDSLQVQLQDLDGVSAVPSNNKKYLNPVTGLTEIGFAANLSGGDNSHPSQFYATPDINVLTRIPIIQGNGAGVQGAFNGGYAPDGTLMFFENAGSPLSLVYLRYNGSWYGINIDSVI